MFLGCRQQKGLSQKKSPSETAWLGRKLWLYAHAVQAPHAASPLDDRTARSRGSPRRCLFPGLEEIPFRSSQQSSLSVLVLRTRLTLPSELVRPPGSHSCHSH